MPNKKPQRIKIYLAGRIPIGDEPGIDPHWREKYIQRLKKLIPQAIFVDPSYREIKEEDHKAVFGHDLFLIRQADLMLVNAEMPVGLGTAQEMVIAKYFQKPIITVSPGGSYYSPAVTKINGKNVKNWHHPFLAILSDQIIEDVQELKPILIKLKGERIPKWKTFVEKSIKYYLTHYFSKDRKTQEILKKIKC